jgi:hypothetical protein
MTEGLVAVRRVDCTEFQNATTKDDVIMLLDIMTFFVYSGNGKIDLMRHCQRSSCPASPAQLISHEIAGLSNQMSIIRTQLLIQNEKCAIADMSFR